jgi:hypothetical protein
MKLIHNGTKVIAIVADTKQVYGPHTVFQGTHAQVVAEISRLNLPPPRGFEDTPGGKQLAIFDAALAEKPAAVASFVKLLEPITALNLLGNQTGDYTAAKTALESVVTDTDDQATLKAQLLACYP